MRRSSWASADDPLGPVRDQSASKAVELPRTAPTIRKAEAVDFALIRSPVIGGFWLLRVLDRLQIGKNCAHVVDFKHELRHVRMACHQALRQCLCQRIDRISRSQRAEWRRLRMRARSGYIDGVTTGAMPFHQRLAALFKPRRILGCGRQTKYHHAAHHKWREYLGGHQSFSGLGCGCKQAARIPSMSVLFRSGFSMILTCRLFGAMDYRRTWAAGDENRGRLDPLFPQLCDQVEA